MIAGVCPPKRDAKGRGVGGPEVENLEDSMRENGRSVPVICNGTMCKTPKYPQMRMFNFVKF